MGEASIGPYELLDFGRGRKLERFGPWIVDRPCPAALRLTPRRQRWEEADWRFEREGGGDGRWRRQGSSTLAERECTLEWQELRLEIRRTPFGQVGVFPEQAENWDWIRHRAALAPRPLKVLNLFGYTGAATLAAAAAGAEAVHVDAARNVIAWARRNAELTLGPQAPIRWIHDDVRQFVRREIRRGHRYDAIVLDPPSYGHGAKGESWKIQRHLHALVSDCAQLTGPRPAFLLLTCHSPGYGPPELEALLADGFFGSCQAGPRGFPLELRTADGRRLPCGAAARYPA